VNAGHARSRGYVAQIRGYAFLLGGAVLSYATPKLAFKVCQAAIDTRADSASNPRSGLTRATTEVSSYSDFSDEDD